MTAPGRPAYRFDPATRLLTPHGPPDRPATLCPHLTPGLVALLTSGSHILAVYLGAWSEIDVDVLLDRGLPPASLHDAAAVSSGVETWNNDDPHYPLNEGLVCKACRQAIGWPTPEVTHA